jgi:hypothetical protein
MPHSTDAIFNSFAAFTKFCIDKKEIPYFMYNWGKINPFFYNMKEKYPKEFEMVYFNTNSEIPFSDSISQAENDMFICGLLYSLTPRFNPHFVSKGILKYFKKKIKNKKAYMDIAEKFYNEFGCNKHGDVGKHEKFTKLEDIY